MWNAVPTAEGALQIAMTEMRVTLFGSEALVIGYGRIGKVLCDGLLALGAHVTASARKDGDLALMEVRGITPERINEWDGTKYDAVFNTVPAMVLPEARLRELKPGCVVVDLASAPGGADLDAAERLRINCRWEPGLPGRYAPESAARIMRTVLGRILLSRGVRI